MLEVANTEPLLHLQLPQVLEVREVWSSTLENSAREMLLQLHVGAAVGLKTTSG